MSEKSTIKSKFVEVKISRESLDELRATVLELLNKGDLDPGTSEIDLSDANIVEHAMFIVNQTDEWPELIEMWEESFAIESESRAIHDEQMRDYDRIVSEGIRLRP